jgi:FkbM family methyltransferase
MKDLVKNILRRLFIALRLPVTKNIEYDIYTERILKQLLKSDSNCVDVGAHKGEILDLFMRFSPSGHHYAFEPIPALFQELKSNYSTKAEIFPYALAEHAHTTTFNLVLDDPAYSGLKKRQYKTENTRVEQIEVEVRRMDEVIQDTSRKITLIKIDVEGGEFDVLKGAVEILKRDKPALIFECGKGASDYYGTRPEEIFGFLQDLNYTITTLKGFDKKDYPLDQEGFANHFNTGSEYYFLAR